MDKIGANMQFQKFEDFVKTRELSEMNQMPNPPAMQSDRRRLVFNNTFKDRDPKEVEQAILNSGKWRSVQDFINDPNDAKYSKLKFPGAGNWVK